jgi:lysophospholipase L1-like esterase
MINISKLVFLLFVGFVFMACQNSKTLSQSRLDFSNMDCSTTLSSVFTKSKSAVLNHNDFTKKHYRTKMGEFSKAPLKCSEIVMLGDSLTEQNNWMISLEARVPVRNRGISGDTSDGVLQRLEEIVVSQPAALFILIGTNDLWTDNTAEKTVSNIKEIIDTVHVNSPDTLLFVQTVFPLRTDTHLNQKVKKINRLIVALASTKDIHLIDTHFLLSDLNGELNENYTTDGVHLNNKGYEAWVGTLRKILYEYGFVVGEVS